MSQRPILLAAGGTGGHLFPAAALAQELARRGYSIELATDIRAEQYGGEFPGAGHPPHPFRHDDEQKPGRDGANLLAARHRLFRRAQSSEGH